MLSTLLVSLISLSPENIAAALAISPTSPDLLLVNSHEENISIEMVRSLQQEVMFRPVQSEVKTLVLFNIDRASLPAQNALLKLLEEPPEFIHLVLTARELASVLPTIQSRCVIQKIAAAEDQVADAPPSSLRDLPAPQTFADVFALSEQYKERDEALQWIDHLLPLIERQLRQQGALVVTRQGEAVLTARDRLRQNVNVRLVLEEMLLAFLP